MGFRTTAVLLLVVGVLVLLLLLSERGPAEPDEITEPVLGGHRVAEAERIVIDRREAAPVMVLEGQDDGSFRIVEPVRDLASAAVLQALSVSYDSARRLVAYTAEEVAAEPRLLAETGVDPPRVRVRFEFPDRETVALDLGEQAPLGSDLFLRMGDTIYRGGLDLFSVLELNVDDVREHQVFHQIPPEVNEMVLQRALPGGGIETLRLRQDAGRVRMLEPVDARVDPNNLQVFFDKVFGMRVERFIAGQARPPSERPDLVVTLRGVLEERVDYWFRPDDTMLGWMHLRGVWFELEGREGRQFFSTAVENLRSHLLVPIQSQNIVQVTLDPGDGAEPASLRRTGTGFRLSTPVVSETDPTGVNNVMRGLRNLAVVEFVEGEVADPEFGLRAGFFTVSVLGQLARAPIHVRLGRDDGQLTYARRDDEDQVVKVPKAVADLLRQPWTRLVANRVQRVTVPVGELRLVQGGREVAFEQRAGRWVARGGDQPLPLVEELVEELVDLRAREVHDPDAMQLDVEPFQLQLLRASGDRLTELTVYDRGAPLPLLVDNGRIEVLFELPVGLSRDIRELRRD